MYNISRFDLDCMVHPVASDAVAVLVTEMLC